MNRQNDNNSARRIPAVVVLHYRRHQLPRNTSWGYGASIAFGAGAATSEIPSHQRLLPCPATSSGSLATFSRRCCRQIAELGFVDGMGNTDGRKRDETDAARINGGGRYLTHVCLLVYLRCWQWASYGSAIENSMVQRSWEL